MLLINKNTNRWSEFFALLCLVLFFITILKAPHSDVLGSLARAQAVDISGGWLHFLDFWEHRPLYYSFVIQVLYYISGGNSLDVFPVISGILVTLSSISFSYCFRDNIRPFVFGMTLLALGSVSYWVLWQPTFFSVIFALLSSSFILSKRLLFNILGYIFLAFVFLMKLTTGTIVLVHLLGLWIIFPEYKKQLLKAFFWFTLISLLLFSFSLLIHNEFESLVVSTVAQGNKSFTLAERLGRSWLAIKGAVIHIPVLIPCLTLLACIFLSKLALNIKFKMLLMLILVFTPNIIQGSKFSYQLAAITLTFIFFCIIYFTKVERKQNTSLVATLLTLSFSIILIIFYAETFSTMKSDQLRSGYTSPLLPLCILTITLSSILISRRNLVLLCFMPLFIIDSSLRPMYLNRDKEIRHVVKEFIDFKTSNNINTHEKVLYLSGTTGAFFMNQAPACQMIYPVPLQRFRVTKVRVELKKIPFVQKLNNCVKSYDGKWILHNTIWFNDAAIKTTGIQSMLDKYKPVKTIGNTTLLKRQPSQKP